MSNTEVDVRSIKFVGAIYPRSKWDTKTVERYADAIGAGAEFPPIILERGTSILLDGKHRLEAHKKVGLAAIKAEYHNVPDGMTPRYYAATLSASHGDRLSNADIKSIAEDEFATNPKTDVSEWGKGLGVSQRTVYRWVSHIIERERADRASKAWRLSKLGWTQAEIGELLDVTQAKVSQDINNCHLAKIYTDLGEHWNEKGIAETANRLGLSLTDCYVAAMDGYDDVERCKTLGIKIQPYDVWYFNSCHDLMGDKHPGRIPGEIAAHVLYFYTKPGDLIIDPMAGSGTVMDAALLMGRKARGYDIDQRHGRIDIQQHNLDDGWPDTVDKANLVFWDPPYFDKMDAGNIGDDGYIDGSISGMDPDGYLNWIYGKLSDLKNKVKPGTTLAFLMSDWDPENAKRHTGHTGIFIWHYADIIRKSGWRMLRHIQVPLPTQQVHPDIVNKFRASRRLARLERYLLVVRL